MFLQCPAPQKKEGEKIKTNNAAILEKESKILDHDNNCNKISTASEHMVLLSNWF